MPTAIRRMLAVIVVFSVVFALALLLLGRDRILPTERPISLEIESGTTASLHFFGRVYTPDLAIVEEVLDHLLAAAEIAFSPLPTLLFSPTNRCNYELIGLFDKPSFAN